MLNFSYHNPVKIVFGKGSIGEIDNLLPASQKIMIAYGGGSIKKNGVYDQVKAALKNREHVEFSGIEANPQYTTLMKAVELAKKEQIDFILAVGGGSVVDGCKFIAAAIEYQGENPWDILAKGAEVKKAVSFGCVLTLPATGSEMNGNAVVSREETKEKLYFASSLVYPVFSILDPESTYSLPERQTRNGIVDAFVHVAEQYLTYPANAPLQDRQAETILLTLVENGAKVMTNGKDYDARANIMWAATHALNGLIGCGVPQDWSTHMIGHELTAFHGLDHGQTLAIVLPAMLTHQKKNKMDKLIRYGKEIWGIDSGDLEQKADLAIAKTREFFQSIGMPTTLEEYQIGDENFEAIAARIEGRGMKLGEHQNIAKQEILEILALCKGK